MTFRTEIEDFTFPFALSYADNILTTGSCFADSIGKKLMDNKFKTLVNPSGAIYNPVSIHRLLGYAANKKLPDRDTFLTRDHQFYCYDFHSSISGKSPEELQENLERLIHEVHLWIQQAHCLIITYGTAWIFERKETGSIVANCHKMNPTLFDKKLLTFDQFSNSFKEMYDNIKLLNPSLKIITTVSPVRHIKDTLQLNSVSKSFLRVGCHQLTMLKNVFYFPAYEILMDDLRDYRFYQDDLIHPNSMAIDYIWEKFQNYLMDESTRETATTWSQIRKSLAHRPFNPGSEGHRKFLISLRDQLILLKDKLDVNQEIKDLTLKLNNDVLD